MKKAHGTGRFAANMKGCCCLLALAGLATNAQAQFVDDCLVAPNVDVGLFAFNLTLASNGSSPFTAPCAGQDGSLYDQWVRFVPTSTGPFTISTLGLSTGDTVLSVHDVTFNDPEFDCGFAGFQVNQCNDNADGTLQSNLILNAIGGLTYLVRVAGVNQTQPVGHVLIEPFIPLAGDACADPLIALDGVNTYDVTQAVINSFVGTCTGFRDVFYRYTPAVTGALTVSACGQATEANLSLIDGCGFTDTVLGCSEFGECFVGASVQAGVPVIIRIANEQATGPEQFTVSLDPNGIPANDTCQTAQVVALGDTAFDNTYATTQAVLACDGGFFPFISGLDVFFEFTPSISGTYDISTENSLGLSDTQLAISISCEEAPFACNDDARGFLSFIRTPLVGGETYSIVVTGNGLPNAGTPVDRGAGILSLRLSVPPSNDECANATTLLAGTWPYDIYDATTGSEAPPCLPQFIAFNNDVWFRYVPTANGLVEALLLSGGSAGSVSVIDSCANGVTLASSGIVADPQTGTYTPRVVVNGQAGSPLIFRIGYTTSLNDPLPAQGQGEISIGPVATPIPANDTCANAATISFGQTFVDVTNADKDCSSATPQSDACTPATNADIFYRFTPNQTGPVWITIDDGETYPAFAGLLVSVYEACYADPITCSFPLGDAPRDFVQFQGDEEVSYIIRVGGLLSFSFPVVVSGSITIQDTPVCDSIDFNNDGGFFDPTDVEAFLSVFSEGPCIPEFGFCNDIDFNNDGSVFDPCDVDSFLLSFSEGPCTPCGL